METKDVIELLLGFLSIILSVDVVNKKTAHWGDRSTVIGKWIGFVIEALNILTVRRPVLTSKAKDEQP